MSDRHEDGYYTVIQLAKTLRISRIAVFKHIQRGHFEATLIGNTYIIAKPEVRRIIRIYIKNNGRHCS